jgi:multidrug efflux pump subunit AcrA (membrane-fusion protein)
LNRATPFTFIVDETRQAYAATIKEIGASVDPTSQTIKVIGAFVQFPEEVLAGMSGTAQFSEQYPRTR